MGWDDPREFELESGAIRARLTNVGATLMALEVPDARGRVEDVVLGFEHAAQYLWNRPYFGCTTGRVANRIAGARFELDGREYRLAANDGPHHLHGGTKGFSHHVWEARASAGAVAFTRTSPDGEEGYPGTLRVEVIYRLAEALTIDMSATSDRATIVNLANHTYWNLAGHAAGDIRGHELQIFADRYTPNDATLVSVGTIEPVAGTRFDFRSARAIGGDYDENFVVSGRAGEARTAARVHEPRSGRRLEVSSTEPGVQLYTGNFLDGTVRGKGGVAYGRNGGFCLETQRYPDAIHHPEWPGVVLRPGETYRHRVVMRFG
jgi:aldose 1-epimerase